MKNLFFVSIFTLLLLSTITYAATIPDTGQTTSYTDIFGEDSDYTINPPSYTKLDGNENDLPTSASSWVMVRDNLTGLIWEVKTNDGGIHDKYNKYDWDEIQNVFIPGINAEEFGGFSDWRLPTIKELNCLVNRDRSDPAIDTAFFPNTTVYRTETGAIHSHYWSSTNRTNPTWGWHVSFLFGSSFSFMSGSGQYARAVRGAPAFSVNSFVDNGDGTITDLSTGLMWQQDGAVTKTWVEALDYCEKLNLGGRDDWRLPNVNELQSIISDVRYSPAINTTYFTNTANDYYWSSTTHHYYAYADHGYAVDVDFYQGYISQSQKSDILNVRAVRSITSDFDDDGVDDEVDNCPGICNQDQIDADNDGIGDVCDDTPGCGGCGQPACEVSCDIDNDGILNAEDICADTCNAQQLDADDDGIGDVCDVTPGCGGCGQPACEVSCDIDSDGILNTEDNCPLISNSVQMDSDNDGVGNACDNCPDAENPDQEDSDSDAIGDACAECNGSTVQFESGRGNGQYDRMTYLTYESEIILTPYHNMRISKIIPDLWYCNGSCYFSSTIYDEEDNELGTASWEGTSYSSAEAVFGSDLNLDAGTDYRLYAKAWTTKSVGIYTAGSENPKLTANGEYELLYAQATAPIIVDLFDRGPVSFMLQSCTDTDNDGVLNDIDNCPNDYNPGQEDIDGDSVGDVCDPRPDETDYDSDMDSVLDYIDNCPDDANSNQADSDSDGVGDVCDICPDDSSNDIDSDGICGNVDNCPAVANPGQEDDDGDGVGNVCDICPNDNSNDIDGDGICGNIDNCPAVANPGQEDDDGDGVGDVCDVCPNDCTEIVPFTEDFSGELPDDGWSYYSSDDTYGRIQIVNQRLRMDVTTDSHYNLNEVVFMVDLAGASNIALSFFQADFGDEQTTLPDQFTGNVNGDGVAISDDGSTWYTIVNAAELNSSGRIYLINLDEKIAEIQTAYDAFFNFSSSFMIKFQQYDNYAYATDGREWDDIAVFTANDNDNDTVYNYIDNCPDMPNQDQADCDGDGLGDVCDAENDVDGDTVCSDVDNCPFVANPVQNDVDSDGVGDICDSYTIYGNISGALQSGITVSLYETTFDGDILQYTEITDANGYYAFGGLSNSLYKLVPEHEIGLFNPENSAVEIPQEAPEPFDFTIAIPQTW